MLLESNAQLCKLEIELSKPALFCGYNFETALQPETSYDVFVNTTRKFLL